MQVSGGGEGAAGSGLMIDACAFHEWASTEALSPYLEEGWREYLLRPADSMGQVDARSRRLYAHPAGKPQSVVTDPAGLDELLGTQKLERIVLGYDDGLLASSFANPVVAREVVRAVNDWTIDRWLDTEARLHAMVLVSAALPNDAAAEIRRAGANERMVAVALGCNALSKPFGHPVHMPIFEAAAEMGLPLVLQFGSDGTADQMIPPAGGGVPVTFGEYRAHGWQAHAAHITSMITNSVFEKLPTLQVLLVGSGVTWIASYLWRFDYWYKSFSQEVPWLKRLPSDYFTRHVRVSTYGLEQVPSIDRLHTHLAAIPEAERMLVYASCYPHSLQATDDVLGRLPSAWNNRVLRENALDLFRWPDVPTEVRER